MASLLFIVCMKCNFESDFNFLISLISFKEATSNSSIPLAIICLITSSDISTDILFIFDIEFFFSSAISFSTAINSLSIS